MTQTSASSSTPRAVSTRDKLVFAAKIAVSAGLLFFCFYLIDFQQPFAAISALDPALLLVAFICGTLGTIILPAVITRYALEISKIPLNLRQLIVLNFAIRFYVIIMPRIVSIWLRWRRYGGGSLSGKAFALLVFERVVQIATMCLFAFGALLIERQKIGEEADALLLLTLAMSVFALLLLAPFLSHWAAEKLDWLLPKMKRVLPQFIGLKLKKLVEVVTAFRDLNKSIILRIAVISAGAFLLFVTSSYIVASALGIAISFVALIWIRSLVFILTLIPISVAGIGLRELGFAGLLALYGIDMQAAIAFSLANFGLQLGMAAIGALFEARGFFNKPDDRHRNKDLKGNIAS
ncbi:MAG: lysylphosphatidylglycerol synthase transmembrane domain-containing protein [Parasphingorhabdus sp.]